MMNHAMLTNDRRQPGRLPHSLTLGLAAALLLGPGLALRIVGAAADSPAPPPAPAGVPVAAPPPAAVTNLAAGPQLGVDLAVQDLGKIIGGDIAKYQVQFTNTGTQTLQISDVRPACGCTTVGSFPSRLEPGQAGSITLQFNSANYSGEVQKTVTVTCNDPVHPTTVLQFKATVWRPVEVTPAFAVFNPVAGAPTGEVKVVRIVNRLPEPLVLSVPVCTNKSFQVELKTIRAGQEFELIIKTVPNLQPGNYLAPVTVPIASTNLAAISVNAFAIVHAPVPPASAADMSTGNAVPAPPRAPRVPPGVPGANTPPPPRPSPAASPGPGIQPATAAARQQELLQQEIKLIEQELAVAERRIQAGQALTGDLLPLRRKHLQLESDLAALKPGADGLLVRKSLLEEEINLLEKQIEQTERRVAVGAAPSGETLPLQRERLDLERELLALEQTAASPTPSTGVLPTPPVGVAPAPRALRPMPPESIHEGLLDEELNLDLSAAVQSYRSLLMQFDSQRPLAANVIFRLAECYRRLGRTDEAKAQYNRILTEFPDQAPLVQLAQKHVASAETAPQRWAKLDFFAARQPSDGGGVINPASAPTDADTRASTTTEGFEYVVQKGDTLSRIVQLFRQHNLNVSAKAITDANPKVTWDKLAVGLRLFIPKLDIATPSFASAASDKRSGLVALLSQALQQEGTIKAEVVSQERLVAIRQALAEQPPDSQQAKKAKEDLHLAKEGLQLARNLLNLWSNEVVRLTAEIKEPPPSKK